MHANPTHKFALRASIALMLAIVNFTTLNAQTPQGINYQAVARTADGTPLADTALDVTIVIAQDAGLNTIDYSEVHSISTNRFGLFTLVIGEGTPVQGQIQDVDWSLGEKFLNVQIGVLDIGTTKLMSVPYALYAESSGNTFTIDSTKIVGDSLIIYFDQDSSITDLSSLIPASPTDTISVFDLVGDSLRIIENQDTFYVNITSLNDTGSDNQTLALTNDTLQIQGGNFVVLTDLDSANELLDSVIISGSDLLFYQGGGLTPLLADLSSFIGNDTNIVSGQISGTDLELVNSEGLSIFIDISLLATDAELAADSAVLAAQIAINQDSIGILKDRADSISTAAQNNTSNIALQQAQIDINQDSIGILNDRADSISTAAQNNTSNIALQQAQIDINQDSIGILNDRADSISTAAQNNTSNIALQQAQIDINQDSIGILNDRADSISTAAQNNTSNIALQQAQIDINQDSIGTLNDRADSISTAAQNNTANIALQQAQIDINQDSIGILNDRADSISTAAQNNTSNIALQQAQIDINQDSIGILNDRADSISTAAQNNTSNIALQQAQIDINQDSIGTLNDRADSISTAAQNNTANIALQQAQIDINQDSIQLVNAALLLHISQDNDTSNTNELDTFDFAGIVGDSLKFVYNGDTIHSIALSEISLGDNLGDHTLDSNLRTNGFYLSNDGDDEGILIDTFGNVGINSTIDTNFALSVGDRAYFNVQGSNGESVYIRSYNGGLKITDQFPGTEDSYAWLRGHTGGTNYQARLDLVRGAHAVSLESPGAIGPDTSILSSSGTLWLRSNGFLNLSLSTNGNVGVGTALPDSLLDVAGGARVQSLNINSAYTFPTNDGLNNHVMVTNGAGQLSFVDPTTLVNPDTLDRIVANDSNTLIMGVGELTANFNNNGSARLYRKGIQFDSNSDLFIGNFLTGQSDQASYGENIGIGDQTFQSNVSGVSNTGVGARVFQSINGSNNTGVGKYAGVDLTSGDANTFIGADAGQAIQSGSNNTFIGKGAGSGLVSISGAVKIGFEAGNQDSTDNTLFIDNSNTNAPLIWGDFANDILQTNSTFRTSNGIDTLSYPVSDGQPNQVMFTDGAGNLGFTDVSAITGAVDTIYRVNNDSLVIGYNNGSFDTIEIFITNSGDDDDWVNSGTVNVSTGRNVGIGTGITFTPFNQNALSAGTTINNQGTNAVGFGQNITVTGDQSSAIGFRNISSGLRTHSYGSWLNTTGQDAITIGSGFNAATLLNNPLDSTLMLGMFSQVPTITLRPGQTSATPGRVGIGTTNPDALLSVESNGAVASSFLLNGNSGTSNAEALKVQNTDSGTGQHIGILSETNGNNASSNTAIKGMAINADTNVGMNGYASGGIMAAGINGEANSTTTESYGVRGVASSIGNAYGIYGTANSGVNNYAGYFDQGAVFVGDSLIIPSGASNGYVLTSDATGTASWQPAGASAAVDTTRIADIDNNTFIEVDSANTGISDKIKMVANGSPVVALGENLFNVTMQFGDTLMSGSNDKMTFYNYGQPNILLENNRLAISDYANYTPQNLVDIRSEGSDTTLSINARIGENSVAVGSKISTNANGFPNTYAGGIDLNAFDADTAIAIKAIADGAVHSIGLYASANGAGDTVLAGLFDQGNVLINDTLILPEGAQNGYVLTSDAAGKATWQPASGGAIGIADVLAVNNNAGQDSIFNLAALQADTIGAEAIFSNNLSLNDTLFAPYAFHNEAASDIYYINDSAFINIGMMDSASVNKLFINGLPFPDTIGTNENDVLTLQGGAMVWSAPSTTPASASLFELNGTVVRDTGGYDVNDFVFGSPQLDDSGNPNHDARMFFDKNQGAFRAGVAENSEWNTANLGLYSTAFGYNNTASGAGSFIGGGDANTASGLIATIAGGQTNIASGDFASVAGGQNNIASGNGSVIGGGGNNIVSGAGSVIAGGESNSTSNLYASVLGGNDNKVQGQSGTILGGSNNVSQSFGEVVLGFNNDTLVPAEVNAINSFDINDRLFIIGNGINSSTRSNALVMLKSGNTFLNGEFTLSDGTDSLTFNDFGGSANNGDVLSYQNGSAIWAPAGAGSVDNDWDTTATVVYNLTKQIGIGTATPAAVLGLESTEPFGMDVVMTGSNSGDNFGVSVLHSQSSTQTNTGFYSEMSGVASINKGFASVVRGGGTNYGLDADAIDPGGFENIGVRALSDSALTNYALAGYAGSQAGGVGYGVFATSAGPGINWAGYFDEGNVNINDTLFLPAGAMPGYVLTSNAAGKATWQAPAGGMDSDWDTSATGGAIFNLDDTVSIGAPFGFGKFNVFDTNDIGSAFFQAGDQLNSSSMYVANVNTGTGENTGITILSNGANASENYALQGFAEGADYNYAVVAAAGNIGENSIESRAITAQALTNTGEAMGVFASATSMADTAFGIYANASTNTGRAYSGYFNEGDVFIKDTLEVDSILKYTHSSVQQGYYLRTNADGTVFADTLSADTCPTGFVSVNQDFCIQQDSNVALTWFQAVLDCNSMEAKLPSLSEWYTGVQVGAITVRNTSVWEWVDGSTSNNTQRAGGGGSDETISMDDPTNSNAYRCIYRLK